MNKLKSLERGELYTVGWIAALAKELAAALAILDERHGKPNDFEKPPSDKNSYHWGRIGDHNVVIASLTAGVYGTTLLQRPRQYKCCLPSQTSRLV
jgi:hypothetical protein